MLVCLFCYAVSVGDGNIVPAVYIHFLNIFSAEVFGNDGILRHFGIQPVRQLFKLRFIGIPALP